MEPASDHETPSHQQPEAVDVPIETPADDAAEQSLGAVPADEPDEEPGNAIHRGLEVSDADAADQARTVGLDDDYR
ncbi:MAG TPA: hypothetical protein VFR11_15745 [Micromonosporaceae bacterium]|jgi:hypothetical protein|nr:hypothetical protein [Micromonosporaceae bacterium]